MFILWKLVYVKSPSNLSYSEHFYERTILVHIDLWCQLEHALLISKAGNQFLNWTRPIRAKHWEVMFLGSLAHRNITSTVLNQNAERDFSDGFTLHWWRISMFTSKRFVHLSCLETLFEIKMVWVSCCWL